MAKIPDEELNRLKYEISLERLVEARGVVLRKRGEELIGLCPFHEDHDPSLVVNPEKNLWHYLGACQAGGSVIDWVMKAEGVSFRHAVELLRDEAVPTSGPFENSQSSPSGTRTSLGTRKLPKKATIQKLKSVVTKDGDEQERLRQVLNYYTESLKQSPEALDYLAKRGIDSGDAIERFRLGYSNRTLGYHIPFKNRREGKEIRGHLEKLGIYRKSGHEHFRGSLVIPVFDENGVVTEVYGRKLNDNLRKGTPMHLYLPGPHRGVWNIDALKASTEVILCESLIDALTFWCAGYRNVTASYGIEGFTADHLDAFKQYGIERVLIAYDRDEPGEKASTSLAAELMAEGMECFRIQFPKGMDANEYALSVKPAEKSLGVVVRKAVWLGKGERPSVTTTSSSVGAVPPCPPLDKDDSECPNPAPFESPQMDTGCLKNAAQHPPLVAESESSEPTASPVPTPTPSSITAEVSNNEVTIKLGDRRWRIRGLEKNMSFDSLRVNVLCGCGDGFHVDTFDLYSARHRQGYSKQAAEELGVNEDVLKKDLGKVLMKLEELQERQINKALNPHEDKGVVLSDKEKQTAIKLLKDPNLLNRILTDFEKCGVVGEETNKLVGYLAAVSRKLEEPLAVVIQSSSAAGKSSLMEAILSFFPHEEQVKYSAMTGQSLFYMGETDLQHKILAIAEEEGAERATYALKLLQSEGELTIASTGKDPTTGRLVTQEYHVKGPVMIFLTTTAIEIDDELLNRCVVLTVDEEREQTRAIHKLQRERQTLEGLLARRDSFDLKKLHQDAQRLLRPLLVANPFATELTFLDDRTRTRRDHMKYLTLIRSIALLHQYQRPIKQISHQGKSVSYIEVTLEDIETANGLAHQVLGRSLDELAPQTRRLLIQLDKMVTAKCKELAMERCDYRFTRREVREHTGWSYDQVRVHLDRLTALEYVLVHTGGRGQSFVYELLFDGQLDTGKPHFMGLIDVESLRSNSMTKSLGGENQGFGGSLGPHLAPIGVPLGGEENTRKPSKINGESVNLGKVSQNAHLDGNKNVPYLQGRSDSKRPFTTGT